MSRVGREHSTFVEIVWFLDRLCSFISFFSFRSTPALFCPGSTLVERLYVTVVLQRSSARFSSLLHMSPDSALKGMRDPLPLRAGAGVKLRVNSLLSVIPGPLGAPVKRVNTGVKKPPCVSFLLGPLSNCYSNLCLCVTARPAAAGERGRGSGPSRAAGGAAAGGEAARKPRRGAGAAETCCYICWVKHGLCCDLKRVLKTHWSVASLKEMKARHGFFFFYVWA